MLSFHQNKDTRSKDQNKNEFYLISVAMKTIKKQVSVFLDPSPSALILGPQPLAPISSALGPQNIARLNTRLLFNFEVAITLKL